MTRDRAETIGLDGLAYLAGRPDQIERFCGLTGMDADAIRSRASDPGFLVAVLDFLLTDDGLVSGFCGENALDPREVHAARHLLDRA